MGRRRASLRAALGVVLLCLLITGITGAGLWRAVFHPTVDQPADPADALLVLGPVDAKLADAVRLMEGGTAGTLVISDQDQRSGQLGECRAAVLRMATEAGWPADRSDDLFCFRPVPVTTQGEAMGIGELGAQRGWDSLHVLAYPEHISRARVLVDRCWNGQSHYLAAPGGPASAGQQDAWNAFWYQSGALVKAGLTPGCDTPLPRWLEELSWRL